MGTRSLPIGFGIGQVGQWSSLFVSWLGRFAQEAVYIEPSFRDRLAEKAQRELGLSLSKEFPNQQLHGIEGVAEDILAYNRQVQRTIGQITTELADVLTSVIQLNEEADVESECLNALSSIAHDVDRREQLPEIRDRLKASIAMLETRFQERKRRQRDLVDNLQNRITVLEKLLDSPNRKQVGAEKRPSVRPAAGQNDPCTGLPARSDAETALRERCAASSSSSEQYAAIFYVHRLNQINAKYGHAVGDSILMLVGQELAIRLINPKDALFRWSGPAFLGILERKEGRGRLESQVKRFLGTSFEHQIDTPGKSVTIPLKVTAHVFEVRDRTSPEICDDIEAFILRTSSDN